MRKILSAVAVIAVIAVAWGIWSAVTRGHPDYRDPVQLAQSLKDAHHGAGASCGKLPTGNYLCVVDDAGGASGTYTVTVAADGSSYQAS